MKKIFLFSVTTLVVFFACDYKKGMLPAPTPAPKNSNACDTVTYSNQIQPIMTNNCASVHCHNAVTLQSGYNFAIYNDCKTAALNGRLQIRCIDNTDPNGPMPPTGLLPQSQRDLLQCWINNGALQ